MYELCLNNMISFEKGNICCITCTKSYVLFFFFSLFSGRERHVVKSLASFHSQTNFEFNILDDLPHHQRNDVHVYKMNTRQ